MNFNKVLDTLKVYEAGKPIELVVRDYGVNPKSVIKLASNENPYGTSKKVVKKLKQEALNTFRYPDDSMFELKEALAKKYDLNSENIIIGSGSDQIIEFCIRAKCKTNSKVLMAKTTFAMYEIYAKQIGANVIKTEDDKHNLAQLSELYIKEGADIIFLCLPNNPLGECLGKDEVYKFLEKIDENTLVVVDGAYSEYAKYKDESKYICPKDLCERFSNTIYLGTFSKAYGLGGARVGYGISNTTTIQTLHKLRPPFNISTLSLVASIEALKDEEFVEKSIKNNFKEMIRYEKFANSKNIEFIPSYTNFITLILDENLNNSSIVSQLLLEKGIIIRNLASYGLNAIRITIGTAKQNITLLKELSKIIEEQNKK